MSLDLLTMQGIGGLLLAAFVAWQLATGLRWIDLGRRRVKVHKATGITLAVLVVPHLFIGLDLAFGIFRLLR